MPRCASSVFASCPAPRHRRFLGAGLHLSLLSHFRGPAHFAQGELDEQLLPQAQARRTSSSTDKLTAAKPDVERAKRILRGEAVGLDEIQDLAERFNNSRYFGYARRLFERAREHPDARRQPEPRVLKL